MNENTNKVMNQFMDQVLKNQREYSYGDSFKSRSLIINKLSCIAIIIADVFSVLFDKISGVSNNLVTISAFIQIISCAIVLTALILNTKQNWNINRLVILFYYSMIIATTTLFAIGKNIVLADAGIDSSIAGLTIGAFLILVIDFAPVPSFTDSVYLGVLVVISFFVPLFCPGSSSYAISSYLMLDSFAFGIYIVFFIVQNKTEKNAEAVNKLTIDFIKKSFEDSLTRTMNKRAYYEYVKFISLRSDAEEVGTVIFDIDSFKEYNDKYSHIKGDEALAFVAKTAMEVLNEKNIYLFRYGGEEFVFFVLNPNKDELISLAEEVRKKIYDSEFVRDDAPDKRITISCGAAIEQIVRKKDADYDLQADHELYESKNNGKNCTTFLKCQYRN